MQQLILTSVLIATFVIPSVVQRRSRDGDADYPRVLAKTLAFAALYVFLLLFVYPRLF